MGKKPYIVMAVGLLFIVGAFVFGVEDPSCGGRGQTMKPGEVCVNSGTGEEQTYQEAYEEQNRNIRIGMPLLGAVLIAYGAFTLFKARRTGRTAHGQTSPGGPSEAASAGKAPAIQLPPAAHLTVEHVEGLLARTDLSDAQRRTLENIATRMRAGLPPHEPAGPPQDQPPSGQASPQQ